MILLPSGIDEGTQDGDEPLTDITGQIRLGGANTIVDIGCYEQGSYSGIFCSQDLTWTGLTNTSWNLNTNWSPNTVPCGNNVTINDETNDPVLDTKGDCANLTINGGAVLTWSSSDSLKVSGNLDLNATSNINHSGAGVLFMSGSGKNITSDPVDVCKFGSLNYY